MSRFQFHLCERTVRQLFRDPLFPTDPSDEDVRAALARLERAEEAKRPANAAD